MSQAIKLAEETDAEQSELMAESPMIYELMSKVMADIGFIAKGRKNIQQGYAFRGIDDVFSALQPALIKHGVFYVPEVLRSDQIERETAKGGRLIYTTLLVAYTFYAPDGSSVHTVVVGEAMDSGDKSSNKAMSAALKYAVLQIFCVPTHETPDADYDSPPPSKSAQKAVQKSGKLAQEHIVDKQTPEQEERDKRVRHILEACGLLKDCDAQKLTTFVNTRFGVEGGINSLSNEQVRELQQIMNSRVDKANAG